MAEMKKTLSLPSESLQWNRRCKQQTEREQTFLFSQIFYATSARHLRDQREGTEWARASGEASERRWWLEWALKCGQCLGE